MYSAFFSYFLYSLFVRATGDKPPRHFAAPLHRGELVTFPSRAKFPLHWRGVARSRAPRDVSRGWLGRGGKRVRN